MDKIGLELFFEQKYSELEKSIRKDHGDIFFEHFLDNLLDWDATHVFWNCPKGFKEGTVGEHDECIGCEQEVEHCQG